MGLGRVVVLVADGVGAGEAPDARRYGDAGANTIANTAAFVGGLRLPTLEKLGLGNLGNFRGIAPTSAPLAGVGRLAERSVGKDTVTGHWELAGLVTEKAFPVFPDGFPQPLLGELIEAAELPGVLGNRPASGTEIIAELGDEHVRSGKPIVYTSADSVFQIAAHESAFGLERLYRVCEIARRLTLPLNIGRVIARPFVGPVDGAYRRTERRRDYAIVPAENCLDWLHSAGVGTFSVGKIDDIFCNRGIRSGNHTGNNPDSLRATLDFLERARGERAFIFVNLVDTDMLYGHRRDPKGFAGSLAELDAFLPKLIGELQPNDLLILTGDHGCDPTFRGTDHTREYVPVIAYTPSGKGSNLGDGESFAAVAATILEGFGIDRPLPGTAKSFYRRLFPAEAS